MQTLLRRYIYVSLLLIVSYCAVAQEQKETVEIDYQSLPDSLITPTTVRAAIRDTSDKAQKLLNIMKERKLCTSYEIDYLQGRIYSDQGKYRISLHYYKRALETAPQANWTQIFIGSALLSNYNNLEDYENVVRYSEYILELADETDPRHQPYIGRALSHLAETHFKLGDKDKAEEYLNKGIQMISGDAPYALVTKSSLWTRAAEWLMEMEQYEQACHYLLVVDSTVTELIRLDSPNHRSAVQVLQGEYIPRMTTVLHIMGRENEAEQWYQKFRSLNIADEKLYHETGNHLYFTRLIVDYLIRTKKYDEALATLKEHEIYLQERNENSGEARETAYSLLSSVYTGLNDYRTALDYAQKQIAVTDSMRILQKESDALEMAVIYETNQKEMLIQKTQSALQQRETELIAAAIGLVLLLAIIILITLNWRKIRIKNRAMVKQIKEMQEQWKAQEQEILNKPLPDADGDILCPESRRDKLCNEIRTLILKEHLYRNSDLVRDDLITRLGVNKTMFIDAFQYCFGTTFPIYINSLRLKDAIALLENSDLSMEEIAEMAGFGTARTFQRQFQKEYGMSPRNYRKMSRN